MTITATHINYFHICHRKLWLFSSGVSMEHNSDTVYDGKLLHQNSYSQRAEKGSEIALSATIAPGAELTGKIDFYDARRKLIHETKRSDRVEDAHAWQTKFYLWLLELNGIKGATAVLEYPRLRQTTEVDLEEPDRRHLLRLIPAITNLVNNDQCPPRIDSRFCKKCSYYDLCYISE